MSGRVQDRAPQLPNPVQNERSSSRQRGGSHRGGSQDRVHRPRPRPREEPPKNRHQRVGTITAHLVAASGEFVGTVLFLWFAFAWHQTVATQSSQKGPNGAASADTVMLISIGYGFSLLVNAFAFYRISGGLFNPAVVLGMVLTGSLPAMRGLFLFPAEILGGIVAAALVSCMFPNDINLVQTQLAPDVSSARGVFIEMFLTSLLIFTIHMLAAEKSKVTFIAPLGIGLSLFVAELAGVYYTGGSLNPARSFGPAVAARSFSSDHWIYWVGPALGSVLAALYFRFVKAMNYEQVNPGQDSADGDFSREGSRSDGMA